jgi:hypothetical protein
VFTWTYKDLKGILLELVQHIIELDTSKPPTHQARYKLNHNYATIVKHDIIKLLAVGFIQAVQEATWLSPILVVPKMIGKLKFCVDFRKLNKAIKKNPHPLPFSNEVLNVVVCYEVYLFLDGYSRYHHISTICEDRHKITFITNWKTFLWMVMQFGVKNGPSTFHRSINKAFK